jgi:hypothetical protein
MIYPTEKVPTMNWKLDVTTKDYYDRLVSTGHAWEFYKDLPGSWEECKEELNKGKEVEPNHS